MNNNRSPMTKKKPCIAIQADPILTLKPGSDTSLFLGAELFKRGYDLFFYTPQEIFLKDKQLMAKGVYVDVTYDTNCHQSRYELKQEGLVQLGEMSAILIRQDPPFDMSYITNTYLLESLSADVPIFNDPAGIRSNSEKMAAFKFAEFMPPSLLMSSFLEEAYEFIEEQGEVVLKPLYWFGGRYIERLTRGTRAEMRAQIEAFLAIHKHVILQKFLSKVMEGDKRIMVIDGKPEAVMRRIPKPGNFVANLAAGGTAAKTDLTLKEIKILKSVGPYLKSQGIIFAGIDMIDEHLIEINVTSPTGLVAIESLYGLNLAVNIVDIIENAIKTPLNKMERVG